MSDPTRNKSIIELLCDAIAKDAIRGWSVNGPNVIFYRDHVRFGVPAAHAESILRKLLADQEESAARMGDGAVFSMEKEPTVLTPAAPHTERLEPSDGGFEHLVDISMAACAWL